MATGAVAASDRSYLNVKDAEVEAEGGVSLDLFPKDSYIGEQYWADLPLKERIHWVLMQQVSEDLREWSSILSQFLRNPLSPLHSYLQTYALPGLGLFTEGYVLFSIGNLKTLFAASYPQCWANFASCSKPLTQCTDYLQIVGIVGGQAGVGIIGDCLGRRWGLIQDAAIMLLGVLMLVVSNGPSTATWLIFYAISQFIYGVGVGGEYPMTGATACEVAPSGSREDKLHRGRTVVLAFLMQGWGQLANILVLITALLLFNGGGGPPYTTEATGNIWRVSFAFIAVFVAWLLYYRIYHQQNVDDALHVVQRSVGKGGGFDGTSFGLLWAFYWHRMIGTAGGWFCNDFMFYGNKIFQGDFIRVLTPSGASVLDNWLWTVVNVVCQLAGYYMAALTIDWKLFGRVRMQALGFFMDFLLFLLPALFYSHLLRPDRISLFQFLYFFSSFWNQFGPNCTTFLLAAEVYPASVRSTGHGISAAVGKLGALAPTILYNFIPSSQQRFNTVCWFGLAGFVITILFVPDTTGLDLREQERRWRYVVEGRAGEYHGIAIHPRHLSMFETHVLGVHKNYDPALDDREERISILQQLTNSTQPSEDSLASGLGESNV